MRSIEFEVPVEVLVEFSQELIKRDLSNSIIDVNDDDEIVIEVEYDRDESDEVDELEEILNRLTS